MAIADWGKQCFPGYQYTNLSVFRNLAITTKQGSRDSCKLIIRLTSLWSVYLSPGGDECRTPSRGALELEEARKSLRSHLPPEPNQGYLLIFRLLTRSNLLQNIEVIITQLFKGSSLGPKSILYGLTSRNEKAEAFIKHIKRGFISPISHTGTP